MSISQNKPVLLAAVSAFALLAAAASTAHADLTLNGSEAFNWQGFPSSITGGSNPTASRPFWDNRSMDGSGSRNIGSYLTGTYTGGTPSGAMPSPLLSPVWWGGAVAEGPASGTSAMDNSLTFSGTGGVNAQLRLEVAGYANRNELGWYDPSAAAGNEVLNRIFSGPDSAGRAVAFNIYGNFGLYLKNPVGQVFFTESFRNRGGTAADLTTQHFAIFANSQISGGQSYSIGVEDLARANTGIEGIGDYNDMVFTITTVPAPASAVLLGVGAAAMARRERRASAK